MQTIEQETPVKSSIGSKSTFDSDNNDEFFDDFSFTSCNFGMYRSEKQSLDSLFLDGSSSRDRYASKDSSELTSAAKDFS